MINRAALISEQNKSIRKNLYQRENTLEKKRVRGLSWDAYIEKTNPHHFYIY